MSETLRILVALAGTEDSRSPEHIARLTRIADGTAVELELVHVVDEGTLGLLAQGRETHRAPWPGPPRIAMDERLAALVKEYGDALDDVAYKLGQFAEAITNLGPQGYLQSLAHKDGEELHRNFPLRNPEDMTDDETNEMLAAMSEKPISHHLRSRPARK